MAVTQSMGTSGFKDATNTENTLRHGWRVLGQCRRAEEHFTALHRLKRLLLAPYHLPQCIRLFQEGN